ncbi:hypothetical protein LZD49_33445 [Dyadobacter sp. CY261]|uniref:hypothetical protein n=1 Tax=Dyadobacter sp. CY261 TaxID=2907203 RepID=UPI001F31452A|nr:hypothetical protein [Dyadobacter sp. CY261]MCF0075432.1 hypothetical protein [Dyadobacter sp. CY261]
MMDFSIGFLKGPIFPIGMALLGAFAYAIFTWIRFGFNRINEKEFILMMFDIGALISAVKIIFLSIDDTVPLDTFFDRTYLAVAGGVTVVIVIKDIISKF